MSRTVCTLTVAAFLSAGFVVLARGNPTSSANAEVVTFTPSMDDDAIRVTVGDIAFEVPRLELKRNDDISLVVVAKDGELCSLVRQDPATARSLKDLERIVVRGEKYSLLVRQPPSSAYFRQGSR